jgi:hypothetical protein
MTPHRLNAHPLLKRARNPARAIFRALIDDQFFAIKYWTLSWMR